MRIRKKLNILNSYVLIYAYRKITISQNRIVILPSQPKVNYFNTTSAKHTNILSRCWLFVPDKSVPVFIRVFSSPHEGTNWNIDWRCKNFMNLLKVEINDKFFFLITKVIQGTAYFWFEYKNCSAFQYTKLEIFNFVLF